MNEIVPDIFTWAWFSEPHGYNFNGYLVRHTEGNLCIDPVPPSDESLADIAGMGVATILLTNRNHSRAANAVRARTGARTIIHPADAAHARSQVGRALTDLGFEALEGHVGGGHDLLCHATEYTKHMFDLPACGGLTFRPDRCLRGPESAADGAR